MEPKDFYALGYRDAIAGILAELKEEIKLPKLAEEYKKNTGEEHFSHKWHTSV